MIQNTNHMADYLRASDPYLTKPGGLSSTEVAVMGTTLVHLPPIPGCETKNAVFFQQHGMSLAMRADKKDIAQALEFMKDFARQNEMEIRQHAVILDNVASKICDLAGKMVCDANKIVLFDIWKKH